MKRTFSFYMQTYLNSGGQPQNNLGCPGLSAMYQWITLNKDNRTTYPATSVIYWKSRVRLTPEGELR